MIILLFVCPVLPAVQEERGPRKNKGRKKTSGVRRSSMTQLDNSHENISQPQPLSVLPFPPSLDTIRPYLSHPVVAAPMSWGTYFSAFRPVAPRPVFPWQPSGGSSAGRLEPHAALLADISATLGERGRSLKTSTCAGLEALGELI